MYEELGIISLTKSLWNNRSWHLVGKYASNNLTKASLMFPLIGYLILFNDFVTQEISFEVLVPNTNIFFLETSSKLRLVFFGLIFLAFGNFLYNSKRPTVLIEATHPRPYVEGSLQRYNSTDIVGVYKSVRKFTSKNKPLTDYWRFTDKNFFKFVEDAYDLPYPVENFGDLDGALKEFLPTKFKFAVENNHDFISCLLYEHFIQMMSKNRLTQFFIILICIFGYVFLLLPSLDLIQAVLISSFSSLLV